MLSEKSIRLAASIANVGAASGKIFKPQQDTPVEVLDLSMKPVVGQKDVVAEVRSASEDSFDGAVQISSHSGNINEMVSVYGDRLRGNLRHIRNEINPLISEIDMACQKRAAEVRADSPINMTVTTVTVPAVYSTVTLEEMLEKYEGRPSADPGPREQLTNKLMKDITPEVYIEMVSTPSNSFNEAVAAIISTMVAEKSYIDLFEKTPSRGRGLYTNTASVVTFLFLRAVTAGKHPSISPSDLKSDDLIYLSRLQAFYGKQTELAMKAIEEDLKSPNFVFMDSLGDKKIYVSELKYRNWLKNGGSLEALIGAFYNVKANGLDLKGLIENPVKFEEQYARAERIYAANQKSISTTEIANITRDMVIEHIVETVDQGEERKIGISNVRQWFKDNRMMSTDDCEAYVARAVCSTVGAGYDAHFIYTEMKAFMDNPDNEEMLIDDAAAYATTKLLGRWIASQIGHDVVKQGGLRQTIATLGKAS